MACKCPPRTKCVSCPIITAATQPVLAPGQLWYNPETCEFSYYSECAEAIVKFGGADLPLASGTTAGKVVLNLGTTLPGDAADCTKALTACGLLAILRDLTANNDIINAIKALIGGGSTNRPPVNSKPLAFDITHNVVVTRDANEYFTDPDGDTLSYTATGLPPGLSLASNGALTGTATTLGDYTVSITASDGKGGTVTGTGLWRVIAQTGTNNAPVQTNPLVFDMTIGVAVNQNANSYFSDPDGNILSFTSSGIPPGLNLASNGALTGTPTTVGNYNVSITANDGNGGTVTGSGLWRVLAN